MAHLVWVPPDALEHFQGLPADLEILPYPDDAAGDPRRDQVEVVVAGIRNPLNTDFRDLPALRAVLSTAAGVDRLVSEVPDGVTLCCGRGGYDAPVAEWIVATMLAAYKELAFFHDEQQAGRWTRARVRMLAGATVLFHGYGAIAEATEERLAGFDVEVLRVARHARPGVSGPDQLPELLGRADVVVVLVPLTESTRGSVDAAFLARMPDHSLLVNAARGAVLDQDALMAELSSGRLRAALDVTDPEPLPDGHPLFASPGVLITPHIAGAMSERVGYVHELARAQLLRYAEGEPLENVVAEGY